MKWTNPSRVARHWKTVGEGQVECGLCPRHCTQRVDQMGFCRVRGNVGGELHTYNYGASVQLAKESIETEAVYHYQPGSRILSLGNVGCMMSCSYCHNWRTSQIKHLDPKNVSTYTPEQVVETALKHDIPILSWTYNDPVVWHEFVMDTASLAKKHGLQNLYKSAFYIEKEPARELCEVIDIFSISLKSMSPEYYRKVTKGRLEPVLDAIQIVHQSGRHLELSQLVVTDLNDSEGDARKTAQWIVETLGPDVPLHFVRFHPDYRYTQVPRTPVDRLFRAKEIALEEGIRHCYLGNVYQDGVSDTHCSKCGEVHVRRFGLTVRVLGIKDDGSCTSCGAASSIRFPYVSQLSNDRETFQFSPSRHHTFRWTEENESVHIVTRDPGAAVVRLRLQRNPGGATEWHRLGERLDRMIVSRSSRDEMEIVVQWDTDEELAFLPVLDRAHYPVSSEAAQPIVIRTELGQEALQ